LTGAAAFSQEPDIDNYHVSDPVAQPERLLCTLLPPPPTQPRPHLACQIC
jgi:hypothetical protein